MATPISKSDEPKWKSFRSDYRLIWLSGLGLLGVFLANLLFIPVSIEDDCSKKTSVFHEIKYQPRDIVKKMIDAQAMAIGQQIILRNDSLGALPNSKNIDSISARRRTELQAKNREDSIRNKKYSAYYMHWTGVGLTDTVAFHALNKALHFKIDPNLLNSWDCSGADSIEIETAFIDLSIPVKIDTTVTLVLSPFERNIDFITRYPGFGVWLLLIFIFSGFCFISISTCLYLTGKRVQLFTENMVRGHSAREYYLATGIMVIILSLLASLWKFTFYDDVVIKDIYFMKTLNSRLKWIYYTGVLAGAFCLAGFIHSGVLLGYFAREIRKSKKGIKLMKEALIATDQGTQNLADPELIRAQTEEKRDRSIHEGLGKTFHSYFILSAVILSLMVLCTGTLYSSVNSLDFIKMVADDWGYSPVRSEFVYLYGALYTIILLIFYVPAHMRLSEIKLTADDEQPDDKRWWNLSKTLFGDLKGVLIAVSPLLTSLAQALMSFLFE